MNKSKCLLIFLLFLIFPNQSSYASSLPQEPLPEFNAIAVGFHNLYEITVSVENGQTVARSFYDPADSPHYSYYSETQTWVDNHPGRNDIELLFPPVRESGRTIWKEFQGYEWQEDTKTYVENAENKAEWNQDMKAYEYINAEHDEGHPVFWLPQMSIRESDDEDKGKVMLAESIETEDFVVGGKNVARIDFYISVDHPYLEYWENLPADLTDKYFSEFYLEQFPWIEGKQIQVKWMAEDVTADSSFPLRDRDIFFHGNYTSIGRELVAGYTEQIEDIDAVNLSQVYDEELGLSNATAAHFSLIWALMVKENGQARFDEYSPILDDFMKKELIIFSESGFQNITDHILVKTK